jgi:hypothetical protein
VPGVGREEPGAPSGRAANRWLLLLLQLPARPSNARVKTWRRLQQLGAVAAKHAVYVLPHSAQSIEDFTWLRAEVQGLKGQASIFTASSVDGVDDRELVEQFRSARRDDYTRLAADVKRAQGARRLTRDGARRTSRDLRDLRARFDAIKAIDFFDAPNAASTEAALSALERAQRARAQPLDRPLAAERLDPAPFQKRTWVTRPRPGVDRCASAWLIRRFIDPKATFAFGTEAATASRRIPFDMYDAGFRHEGRRCTFEVLQHRFGLDDPTVQRIGEIVHDIDLKEDAFRAPQTPTVAALVEGLRASFADDQELLRHGVALFQALYEGLKAGAPRAGARPRSRR